MRKIVVGVDESAEAIAALSWALDNATADDTVLIIHAWQMPTYEAMDPMMYDPSEIESGAKRVVDLTLEAAAEKARSADPDRRLPEIDASVGRGHPGRLLIEASSDADLLVVGSRGHGGFVGLLLGSVSTYAVHHAQCPVVVVPHRDE
ncbi:MAG: universal stress protein [Acidimicrobiales bacterium]